jgi:hypothetical protein
LTIHRSLPLSSEKAGAMKRPFTYDRFYHISPRLTRGDARPFRSGKEYSPAALPGNALLSETPCFPLPRVDFLKNAVSAQRAA